MFSCVLIFSKGISDTFPESLLLFFCFFFDITGGLSVFWILDPLCQGPCREQKFSLKRYTKKVGWWSISYSPLDVLNWQICFFPFQRYVTVKPFTHRMRLKIFLELLFGHECFHTECEYHTAQSEVDFFSNIRTVNKSINFIVMVVRSGRHVRLPQQQHNHNGWQAHYLRLSASGIDLTNTLIIETTILKTTYMAEYHPSVGLSYLSIRLTPARC